MNDLRYALRRTLNPQAPHLRVVIMLGIAIGIASALCGVAYQITFRPFGVNEPERIVAVSGNADPPFEDALAYWSKAKSFETLATYGVEGVTAEWDRNRRRVTIATVSASMFDVLQCKPLIGRLLNDDQQQVAGGIAVLSERMWTSEFGRAGSVLGQQLRTRKDVYTIVGVVDGKAAFPPEVDVWILRGRGEGVFASREESVTGLPENMRSGYVGLLRPGVSSEQTRQELTTMLDALSKTFTARLNLRFGEAVFITPLRERYATSIRELAAVLSLAGGLLLAIGVSNSMGLLLVDALRRQQEVVVRVSIGASPWAITRMMLAEAVCLAICSGMLGIVVANAAIEAIRLLSPDVIRAALSDIQSILISSALIGGIGVGAAMGIPAALQALGVDAAAWLGGRRRVSKSRRWLAVVIGLEISLALMALMAEGTIVQSVLKIAQARTGFDSENVIVGDLNIEQVQPRSPVLDESSTDKKTVDEQREIEKTALKRYVAAQQRTLRTVSDGWRTQAGLVDAIPFGAKQPPQLSLKVGDQFGMADAFTVAGDYLPQMGIAVLKGRSFSDLDSVGSEPVMMVSQPVARRLWRDGEALGRAIEIEGEAFTRRVVGVVEPVMMAIDQAQSDWQCYIPATQPFRGRPGDGKLSLVVNRLHMPHGSDAGRILWERMAEFGPTDIFWLKTRLGKARTRVELMAVLFGAMSTAAVALAAIGAHLMVAYAVANRRQELAIRTALGASKKDIVCLVLSDLGALVVAGGLAGIIGAFWSDQVVRALLPNVVSFNVGIAVPAVAVVAVIVCIAAIRPVLTVVNEGPAASLK